MRNETGVTRALSLAGIHFNSYVSPSQLLFIRILKSEIRQQSGINSRNEGETEF